MTCIFFSFTWRKRASIKNNSVTPHVSFDKYDSVTLYVSFDKNNSATPYILFDRDNFLIFFIHFFSWRPKKNQSWGHQLDLKPGLQGVSSQHSPLPTEIHNLIMSVVIYDNSTIDMIALRFKIKVIVFSTENEPWSPVG